MHEWPLAYDTEHKAFEEMKGICKEQRIKERQLRGKRLESERVIELGRRRKRRKPLKPVWYRVDPEDERVLILRNGRRLKQMPGVSLYLSKFGDVYSLTRYGLRKLRANITKSRRKKTRNGVSNGRRYPFIQFRGGRYTIHIKMVEIWIRPKRKGEEVDHLDGNIKNLAYRSFCRL